MRIVPVPFDRRRSQRAFAVIAVMAMIAIMMICLSINLVAINTVDRELKLVEKKQSQHWQTAPANPGANGTATQPDASLKPHD